MKFAYVPRTLLLGTALALLAIGPLWAQQEPAEQETDPVDRPYIVENGKVDKGTYNGYRRYHNSCHVCHGPDGLGSTFAPDLTESLKRLSYEEFAETVAGGREQKGMPVFGTDPNVMLHLDDIYGYLKARSDGVLGRGRPERLPS